MSGAEDLPQPLLYFNLADWHADPLDSLTRENYTKSIQALRRQPVTDKQTQAYARIAEILISHSTHDKVPYDIQLMLETETEPQYIALANLVYGQLLMSRKLKGAYAQLQKGLHLASPLIDNKSYFAILKRHTILNYLLTGEQPAPVASLDQLVNEALIIRKLRPRKRFERLPQSDSDIHG